MRDLAQQRKLISAVPADHVACATELPRKMNMGLTASLVIILTIHLAKPPSIRPCDAS
jgi:hypothetical protein